MPHIPRRTTAPLGSPPPELQGRTTQQPAATEERPLRQTLGVGKLSLSNHRGPKPADVYKQLFGKEADVDGYTGALVYSPSKKT